jgi:hypothetical protein
MKKPTKITAWSYSRLKLFGECARKFKYQNIDKLDSGFNEAMARGNKIHKEIANYLDGTTDTLPHSALLFRDQMEDLKSFNPIVEQQWAFNRNWKPVSWFDKKTYARIILDALTIYKDRTADIIDHKSGKRYDDDYRPQMGLFAAGVYKMFPTEVDRTITTRLWYLDSGDEVIEEFTKEEALDILADIEEEAELMMNATRWPATPSWKCGGTKKDGTEWGCHFRKSNGGPCEYG